MRTFYIAVNNSAMDPGLALSISRVLLTPEPFVINKVGMQSNPRWWKQTATATPFTPTLAPNLTL